MYASQDDSKIEKIGSRLGLGKVDHDAEVVDLTTSIRVDSLDTAKVCNTNLV